MLTLETLNGCLTAHFSSFFLNMSLLAFHLQQINPRKILCKFMMRPRGNGASCMLAFPEAEWRAEAELPVYCSRSTLACEVPVRTAASPHWFKYHHRGFSPPLKDVNTRRGNCEKNAIAHTLNYWSLNTAKLEALSASSSESIKGRSIQCQAQASTCHRS